MFNARPYINLAELEVDLQLSTKAWCAQTAHAWAAIHTYNTPTPNPKFRLLLQAFLVDAEDALLKTTDHHHLLPVLLTLTRLLWSMQEWEANPIVSFVQTHTKDR